MPTNKALPLVHDKRGNWTLSYPRMAHSPDVLPGAVDFQNPLERYAQHFVTCYPT